MNVLKPTEFHGCIEHGGSTKPWKVSLSQNDGTVDTYVVKLFTPLNITQYQPVAKEIYGNILAKEFCLPVPEIALVDINDSFVNFVLSDKEREILKKRHSGLKFASKLADGMSIVAPGLYKDYLKDYEISSVFAYDSLLFNLDRGGYREKPNLIVDDENFLLIDHEQIFPFANNTLKAYEKVLSDFKNDKSYYQFSKHLLYPVLKSYKSNVKKHIFDEFGEYLSKMQTNDLEEAISTLNGYNVATGQYDIILNYLHEIKKHHNKFCDILSSALT